MCALIWWNKKKKLKRKLLTSIYHCIQQHPQLGEGAEHPCFSWYNCRFNWNHLARPSFVELDSVSSVWFLGPARNFYLQTGKKDPRCHTTVLGEGWVPGKSWAVLETVSAGLQCYLPADQGRTYFAKQMNHLCDFKHWTNNSGFKYLQTVRITLIHFGKMSKLLSVYGLKDSGQTDLRQQVLV